MLNFQSRLNFYFELWVLVPYFRHNKKLWWWKGKLEENYEPMRKKIGLKKDLLYHPRYTFVTLSSPVKSEYSVDDKLTVWAVISPVTIEVDVFF